MSPLLYRDTRNTVTRMIYTAIIGIVQDDHASLNPVFVPVTHCNRSAYLPLFHLLPGSLTILTQASSSFGGIVKMSNGDTVRISEGTFAMDEEIGHPSSFRCDDSSPSSLQVTPIVVEWIAHWAIFHVQHSLPP